MKSEERVFNSELSVRLQNGVGVSGRHSERRAPRVAPHQRLQQRMVGVSQRLIRTADGGDVRGAESRPAILAESQPALKFRVNRPQPKISAGPVYFFQTFFFQTFITNRECFFQGFYHHHSHRVGRRGAALVQRVCHPKRRPGDCPG